MATRLSSLPAIPVLPSGLEPSLASFLYSIKEILDIYGGSKGNRYGLDRVVTYNDISVLDPTTFSALRSSYARIIRVSGSIVRTGKIESTDSSTYIDLDNQKMVFNGKINYASQMPGIFIGKDDDNVYKFNLGHDSTGSLKFDGVNTYLGLWSITPNGIGDNLTENSSKIFLDKTNTRIRVGPSTGYVNIDGDNVKIESSNYVSGVAGAGFHLHSNLLEVGNIACRGIFRTAVFQKDVVSAIGGNLMVRPADVLDEDMSANDAGGIGTLLLEDGAAFLLEDGSFALGETGVNYQLSTEGNETFAVGDFLRIKDGIDDEWFEVIDATGAPEKYLVTRDKAGDYSADSNPTWTKGATVVNYGASGDGGVYMTSSESNAPYTSVWTHAGAPWTTITTHLRLGNLNGFLGYSSDLYGIAIGSTNKYLKYDPTNDLRIQGNITVTGSNGYVKIYDAVPTERVRLGNLNGFLGYSSDLYGVAIGETAKYLKYDPTNGLRIGGSVAVSGTLSSSDWAAAAGVRLDLDNKWLKMGGSNVTAAGAAAGIFLGLDTNYKFYVGDGSEEYFMFDATNVSFSTAKSGGGVYLRQGGDIIMEGGATGNPSLLRFKDEAVPGEIRYEQSGNSSNYHKIYKASTYDSLYIEPINLTLPALNLGTGANAYNNIDIYSVDNIDFFHSSTSRVMQLSSAGINCQGHTFPNSDSTYTLGTSLKCWLNIYGDAGVTACSDRKWKKNIKMSPLGLDFINKLDFIEWEFDSKTGKTRKGKFHGMLAQDVLSVLEGMGYKNKDFAGVNVEPATDGAGENWGLVYEQFIAPLGRAIQELSAKVEALTIH